LNFNVLDTLVQLRRQRPGMVQTKEQLIYWSVAPLSFTSLSVIHHFFYLPHSYLAILEKVITHCNILDFQNERY